MNVARLYSGSALLITGAVMSSLGAGSVPVVTVMVIGVFLLIASSTDPERTNERTNRSN